MTTTTEPKGRKPTPTPFSQLVPTTTPPPPPPPTTTTTTTTTTEPNLPPRPTTNFISPNDFGRFSYADHWREYEIHLERVMKFFCFRFQIEIFPFFVCFSPRIVDSVFRLLEEKIRRVSTIHLR